MTTTKKRSKSQSLPEPVAITEVKRCDLCGAETANLSYREGNAACEKCAAANADAPPLETPPKRRTRAKAGDAAAGELAGPKAAKSKRKERAAETAPTDASTENASPTADVVTLSALCERYISALDAGGEHSMATTRSYGAELRMACREIGSDVPLVDLTVARVERYFRCATVTNTRDGEPKSAVGVAKTCRVLRQALLWAQHEGLIAQAPLPTAKD